MYPSIYYLIKDLLGFDLPFFKMVQTFGFFVAIAFLSAAYVLGKEFKRKEKLGLLSASTIKVLKGQRATTTELIISGLIGFLIGYKLLYVALDFSSFIENTQGYLLSTNGSLIGGLIGAAISAFLKYREKEKTKLATPVWQDEIVHPYQHVGNIVLISAGAGILGAKIFHNLENWDSFIADPVGALVSFDGLTMYGGLICASIACIYYGRKKNIPILHLIDIAAPAIMLGYGVGRIGCHLSGDGDWGILNSAYASNPNGTVSDATMDQLQVTIQNNQEFYIREFGSLEQVEHVSYHAPSFLPDWMFAYSYPHNVLGSGIPIQDCVGKYCNQLPIPVYPTAFYEVIMCISLFFVLWYLRKKITIPGMLFSIYLILNGVERFFIEKIRVNTNYNIGDFRFTQAELISTILFILGVIGVWYFRKKAKLQTELNT